MSGAGVVVYQSRGLGVEDGPAVLLADAHGRPATQAGIAQPDAARTARASDGVRSTEAVPGLNVAVHGLRGVGSMMVLLAHIAGGTARHVYPHDAAYVRLIAHPWNFGTFGVEIFFVISGFVILPSAMRYSAREFAGRRFLRLYPLFFVLSVLFVALNHMTNAYPGVNDGRSIIAGFLFLNLFTGTEQLTPNAWSLSFEVAFYVLTALTVNAAVRRHGIVGACLAVLLAAAFLLAFPIAVYFLIGIALRLAGREARSAGAITRAIEAASFASLVWFASRAHFDYTSWTQFRGATVPMILASITTYFSMALMRRSLTATLLGGRVFAYLGEVSYSLYLVHPFVYFACRALFVHQHWFTDDVALSLLCFAAVVVAGSLLATHYVHRWLELWPYNAVFHQRIYHRRAGQQA